MPNRPLARLAGLTFVLLTACSPSVLLGPDAEQGIDGLVLRGPICPVQHEDDPCPPRPHQSRIRVRTTRGERITTVRSGEDGRFRIGLESGTYVLDPESGDPFPVAGQMEVVVTEGMFTSVTIHYDTGIR